MTIEENSTKGVRLIPKLRTDCHNVPEFNIGEWTTLRKSDLDHISDGLNLTGEGYSNSIPDIWARLLVFETALFNEDHPMHQCVNGEWKGLLAILALKEWLRLPIRIIQFELPGDRQTSSIGSTFLKALSSLIPKRTISPDTDWHYIHIVAYEDVKIIHPIGILTPTTIVATASDINRLPDNFVPWFENGILRDPVDYLNQKEKEALSWWLVNLKGGKEKDAGLIAHIELKENEKKHAISIQTEMVANENKTENKRKIRTKEKEENQITERKKIKEKLLKCIGDSTNGFIGELRSMSIDEFSLSKDTYGLQHGFYSLLNEWLSVQLGDPKESPVRLELKGRQNKKIVLVIDGAIADQWKCSAKELLVLGNVSLQKLMENPNNFAENRFESWTVDDFFCNKLVGLKQSNAFPGTIFRKKTIINGISFIPPIKSQVVEYLSPHYIGENLTFSEAGNDIKVELRLELRPEGSDQSRIFRIKRIYKKEDAVIVLDYVPLVVVWPYLKAGDKVNSWKAYYTYFSTGKQSYEETVRNKRVPSTFYAKPYTSKHLESYPIYESEYNKNIIMETTKTETFPEAIMCSIKLSNQQSSVSTFKDCGILLLPLPETKPQRDTWDISIDFGTTSTSIFYKERDETKPLEFKHSGLMVTEALESIKYELGKEFIPASPGELDIQPKMPFLTLLVLRKRDRILDTNDTHILKTIIYFLQEATKLDSRDKSIRSDLKWGKSSEDRLLVEMFLKQLVLMAAAEAIERGASVINWHFSYPSAFSEKQLIDYKCIWNNLVDFVKKETGLLHDEFGNKKSYTTKTEAVAVGMFFKKVKKAPLASGAICMDVGGGTSDISIWQGDTANKLILQTSLRYAGHNIFADALKHNLGIVGKLKPSIKQEEIVGLKKLSKAQFYTKIDAYVSERGGEWLKNVKFYSGEESFVNFRRDLAIRICGLFFYSALLIEYAIEKGLYKISKVHKMPHIYLAGNGARILHWLCTDGKYIDGDVVSKCLLKPILLSAAGIRCDDGSRNFGLSISPEPKTEVAHGLILDPLYNNKIPEQVIVAGEPYDLIGESTELSNNSVDKNSEEVVVGSNINKLTSGGLLTEEILQDGITTKALPNLERFLKLYNECAQELDINQVDIPDKKVLDTICKRVKQILVDKKAEAEVGSVVVEPIFLLGLKELLQYHK